ncbi:putative bifunctional diguanylate cyclase/phosphodiesterase [Alicyclobacillus vulcanalis]|uniref:PAS domain S-box-containing protein/diguanylate cyclase (GGDEF) domain-containing protein n=2 Tax=Alicyclobacillus TaxID=29330 RepID=A0A1N7LMV1_9BACL|nr:EAL domain-containing protein [Alicyclobacillus vulcanalis]SIS75147.1 PAS domain S-box-containing protein/diguanylate cyclase (GGDEF) domain-containing protein [Alicyclobacillus vulcanalis]
MHSRAPQSGDENGLHTRSSEDWLVREAPLAVFGVDADNRVNLWSAPAARMLGWDEDEIVGQRAPFWWKEGDFERYQGEIQRNGCVNGRLVRWRTKDGGALRSETWAWSAGAGGLVFVVTDQVGETEMYAEVEQSRSVIERIAEAAEICLFVYDAVSKRLVYASKACQAMSGYACDELVNHPDLWRSLLPGEVLNTAEPAQIPNNSRSEYRIRHRDGSERWVAVHLYPRHDAEGRPRYLEGLAMDITDRKHHQVELQRLAFTDALTQLPNRQQFEQDLREAVMRAERRGEKLAVFLFDFDGFKYVNDTFGHQFGDATLKAIAERLRETLRGRAKVYRMGGDEFTVIQAGIGGEADVRDTAGRCLEAFHEPLRVMGESVPMGISIGAAIYPDHSRDVDALLRYADIAMYAAKEQGGHRLCLYSESGDSAIQNRLLLHNALPKAFDRGEFSLDYQPIFDVRRGRFVGAEALLRWNSPEFGFVPPAVFVPFAEQWGLMQRIGTWVLETACRTAAEWQRQNLPLRVSVNVSFSQLADPHFVEGVAQALRQAELSPRHLQLEVHASLLAQYAELIGDLAVQLDRVGVSIAIDDFGHGEAVLAALSAGSYDAIKLHPSLLTMAPEGERHERLMAGVVRLAHDLGMRTIAEGVERREQELLLARTGCDEMQGFWKARPASAQDLAAWCRQAAPRDGDDARP